MRRCAFNLATVVSLLLFLAIAVLWVCGDHFHHRFGVSTRYGRFTLHSGRSGLYLAGPPPVTSAASEAKAERIASRLRNRDICWQVYWELLHNRVVLINIHSQPVQHTAATEMSYRVGRSFRRSLLLALDDPERFVAAHCRLIYTEQFTHSIAKHDHPDGSLEVVEDGLRVTLLPGPWNRMPEEWDPSHSHHWICDDPGFWRVDFAQLPAIRDQWHDRLDVRIISCPYWLLSLALLIPPILWLLQWLRGRRRKWQNLCLACGYDLRATTDRCPECGTVPMVNAGG